MTRPWTVLEWAALGLCAQVDLELMHPENGQSDAAAKNICRRCEVRRHCLSYAIDNDVQGIWGGTNDADRAKIREARAA